MRRLTFDADYRSIPYNSDSAKLTTCRAIILAALTIASAQPSPGAVLWVYDAGEIIRGSPALANDGTVYISAGLSLFAVTNSGSAASSRWTFPLANNGGNWYGSPSLGADGTLYVAGGNLYAINPDGSQRWSYPGVGTGCPAVGWDSSLYVQGGSCLYSISREGVMRWCGAAGGGNYTMFCSAAIGSDGSIYIDSPNVSVLYALKPDGIQEWYTPLGIFNPADSPAIGADGTVYISAGQVYALSPAGSALWGVTAAGSPASPAIGPDGTIYVEGNFLGEAFAGYGMGLYAVAPSGELRWQMKTNLFGYRPRMLNTPAIDSAGVLYCTAYNSLIGVSPDGNVQSIFRAGDSSDDHIYSYTSPAIGPDGTIYATFGSRLFAFAGTNKLADSPWPMYRQNPRHTGKVEKPAVKPPQKRSDANFEFELFGQLGDSFTIESSSNLVNWTQLTNFVATNVPMDVVDPTSSNAPYRFYRATSP